jgi:all-trans-retinol 13,14-reductase
VTILPIHAKYWIDLRGRDREKYNQEKETIADRILSIIENHVCPHLRQNILYKDIFTPATLARYSGSPTGSIYDMACVPENFGNKRLKMKTPIQNLYITKFAHGIFGSLNSGLQAIDMIMDKQIMGGNSRF